MRLRPAVFANMAILTSLFVAAFVSATLLPGSSEAVLAGVLAAGGTSTALAIGVATVGNTLGSCVNWGLGRYFTHFRHRPWFPLKPAQFERYENWYHRWGIWSLMASWVPIIGDPLTVIAGVARTPFWLFASIVLLAKLLRYLAVAGLFNLFWQV